ncbi:MAG: type II toxin-antitoxin system RelE/ParE family toxin [Polyangia bacterium]|jgi:toxin ParE1/3/4
MRTRSLQVVWTEVAAADLERIGAYLTAESPLRAASIIDRIVERAESLTGLPNRGRTPPELRGIGDRSWRELQEPPWRIVYRRLDEVIQIHAVLDGRRSLEDILMERVLKT